MKDRMQTNSMVLLLGFTGLLAWQDPRPPERSGPEPVSRAAARAEVPGKPVRHPLEGVYKLTGRVVNGVRDRKPSKGYLAITGRHLFLNLASPGLREDRPLVNAGVREWREVDGGLRTTTRLDFFSDGAGDLHFVRDGKQEHRRIVQVAGGLRVMQAQRTWLEFERVE